MTSDHFAVRVVVVTIAAGALIGLAAVGYLATTGTTIPDQLDRLVTLFAGALIGVLARTSSTDDAQQVQVVNPPADPVNVADAPVPPPNVDPANPRH